MRKLSALAACVILPKLTPEQHANCVKSCENEIVNAIDRLGKLHAGHDNKDHVDAWRQLQLLPMSPGWADACANIVAKMRS